ASFCGNGAEGGKGAKVGAALAVGDAGLPELAALLAQVRHRDHWRTPPGERAGAAAPPQPAGAPRLPPRECLAAAASPLQREARPPRRRRRLCNENSASGSRPSSACRTATQRTVKETSV